jgi:hypothetical protein
MNGEENWKPTKATKTLSASAQTLRRHASWIRARASSADRRDVG